MKIKTFAQAIEALRALPSQSLEQLPAATEAIIEWLEHERDKPSKKAEYNHRYYIEHREELRNKKTPEERAAYQREWRRAHREQWNAYQRTYRRKRRAKAQIDRTDNE